MKPAVILLLASLLYSAAVVHAGIPADNNDETILEIDNDVVRIEEENDEEALPDLESLPESEPWPTPAHFSDDPTAWPGHGQPLASASPVTNVDKLKSFPSRKTFIEDYYISSTPLQMLDAMKGSKMAEKWPDNRYYTSNGMAVFSWVNTTQWRESTNQPGPEESSSGGKEMSLQRYFRRRVVDQLIGFEGVMADFLRMDFSLPVSIQCVPLIKELQSARLRSMARWTSRSRVVSAAEQDRLTCAISGTKTVWFASFDQILRDSNFTVEIPEGEFDQLCKKEFSIYT